MIHLSKSQLRKSLRQARRGLSKKAQKDAAYSIRDVLFSSQLFINSQCVATYIEIDGEISTRQINQTLWKRNTRVVTSKLHPLRHNRLRFFPYQPDSTMCENHYRILEPNLPWHKYVSLYSIDTLLIPLVGFDASCNRLGMGKGFYDRTINEFLIGNKRSSLRLIGLAHDCQEVAHLPTEPWDIQLSAIATPSRLFYPK